MTVAVSDGARDWSVLCSEFAAVHWLGKDQEYGSTVARMRETVEQIATAGTRSTSSDTQGSRLVGNQIWFLEHAPVITTGRRTGTEEVFAPDAIPVVQTERGGKATWHGPGQLVVYPIISVEDHGFSTRSWVNLLLETTWSAVHRYVDSAVKNCETVGVYTPRGKIASLGIRIRKGVSFHGISMNVDLRPNGFQWIDPCGVHGGPVDQISTYAQCSMHELGQEWLKSFESNMVAHASGQSFAECHDPS